MSFNLRIVLPLCLVLLLVPVSAMAQHQRTGIDVMGGVGMNMCVGSGDMECTSDAGDYGVSWNLFIAGGYRFLPIIGAYLDLSYGRLTYSLDDLDGMVSTLVIMPTIRGFTTFAQGEVYLGLGVGYSDLTWEMDSDVEADGSWSNLINFKINVGADYNVNDIIAVGINADYVLNMDGSAQYCANPGSTDETCARADMIDLIQIGLFVKGTFAYSL